MIMSLVSSGLPSKATISLFRCLFAHVRHTLQQKTIGSGPLSEERSARTGGAAVTQEHF
jgi:hypothetical protein